MAGKKKGAAKVRVKRAKPSSRVSVSKVIVYSTGICPYCNMAKDYLKGRGVAYVDIDVIADMAKAQEMIKKSGQLGVPVLDINGTIIVGFNRDAIDQALAGRK